MATGEWIFSGALYGETDPRSTRFHVIATEDGADLSATLPLYQQASPFIEDLAHRIAAQQPDVIGFTSTFQQNVPSLALARAVKQLLPEAVTVFGGANCDGRQGQALHRAFPFIDYVVRGEGERVFSQLLDLLGRPDSDAAQAAYGGLPGLCWRTPTGESRPNPQCGPPLPMNEVPTPSFKAYFDQLADSHVRPLISPRIWLEGSRGCWWGAKHHCTFCGLNGTTMPYRSKPAHRLWSEISQHSAQFKMLDIKLTDNILDMNYLKTFLPLVRDSELDLRIFSEIKSNLDFAQLATLADAHVVEVQPGIESLSSRVLKLMRKGVTGAQNVRLLRDCETLGITVRWSYLYGFPGETYEDYSAVLGQFPALVHLQPPTSALRIQLERFSPYFDDPSLGLPSRGPARYYRAVHDLPEYVVADLVYLHDSDPAGINGEMKDQLEKGVEQWNTDARTGSLMLVQRGHDAVSIEDTRAGRSSCVHHLDPGLETTAYLLLLPGRSRLSLGRALEDRSMRPTSEVLTRLLETWLDAGLVFVEADTYVALAVGAPDLALSHLMRERRTSKLESAKGGVC
ncbi:RiPP maturation radical SAM C-methyltransferase [Streptomyces mayteni]